ncbi:MAG TPA: hypothetical protein PLE74_08280 [Candidatus Cloacimonadota bacterium]|nr:hypothetical protein [Candidatus Cloacimonadota bacterium]HPT72265.1 hypothetical protein [Candidatus Cloacimonadota bacterium]
MRRKKRTLFCPKNRNSRSLAVSTCCICERMEDCGVFRSYYRDHKLEYNKFVYDTLFKFPEKYQLEVILMAEKKQFVQVVDVATNRVEKVVELDKLERLSPEDKLALTKGKQLFLVTHVIEPVVKIEMKKRLIDTEMKFHHEEENPVTTEPILEVPAAPETKGRGKKK